MRKGGQVYADFTLSRISRDLDQTEPLTDSQKESIHKVLLAQQQGQRHSLDIRLFIPLIFRNYYVTLFAGRDRRRATLEIQRLRWGRTQRSIVRVGSGIVLVLLSFLLAIGGFFALYKLKTAMGIDIFPGMHLSDLLSEWFGLE